MALLLFAINLLCLKKWWFPTQYRRAPGRCSIEGTTGKMGWSRWWRGLKTLLKGTQLLTGALFPPFLHQEKFNPMTFCSQSCIAMLEAIDILFCMRRDREQPIVYSSCNPALSHQGVFHASVPQWDLKGQSQSFLHILITFIICPVVSRYYYSLLIFVIIPEPPQRFPRESFSYLSLYLSLAFSLFSHSHSFCTSHTYSWCSNSQSIRCPKHIKYGSTCNHACWKLIVFADITWIHREVYQSCHADRTLAVGTQVIWEK